MPSNIIIAAGGTGQTALQYYVMLYLSGIIEQPFHALVVDTDTLNDGLKIAKTFFENLQTGRERQDGLAGDIPTLDFIRIQLPGSTRVSQAVAGFLPAELPRQHQARAFFDDLAIQQDIGRGLFGTPALGSLLKGEWLTEGALQLPGPEASDVTGVLVGCLTGGTGGGLITPLIDQIRTAINNQQSRMKLRAVFFADYFTPDTRVMPREVHESNLRMTSRSLEEIGDALDYFVVVGHSADEWMGGRDHNREKTGRPHWPDSDMHPHWLGVLALHWLLQKHDKQEAANFAAREVETQALKDGPINWDAAKTRLRTALGRVSAFVAKELVPRIAADPLTTVVWGQALTTLLEGLWTVAASKHGKDAEFVKAFPRKVQEKIKLLWEGNEGLRGFFPDTLEGEVAKPAALKRVRWPELDRAKFDMNLFAGQESAIIRPAATLLFGAMRG